MSLGPEAVDEGEAASDAAHTVIGGRRRRRRRRATDDVQMMMMIGSVVVVVVMMSVVVCVVESSSIALTQDGDHRSDIYGEEEDDDDVYKHIDCQTENGKCSKNQHCCHGYVCSQELDQESSSESEAVGICRRRRRRDRQLSSSSCLSDDQCARGSQCIVDSDNSGQGFCRTAQTNEEEREKEWSEHMYRDRRGGLGSACETTSDCNPFTIDGNDRLCCQDVRRGRQGTKRMCDRVTGISVCIH